MSTTSLGRRLLVCAPDRSSRNVVRALDVGQVDRVVQAAAGHRACLGGRAGQHVRPSACAEAGVGKIVEALPTRVMPSTTSTIAKPGNSEVHQMPLVTSDSDLLRS